MVEQLPDLLPYQLVDLLLAHWPGMANSSFRSGSTQAGTAIITEPASGARGVDQVQGIAALGADQQALGDGGDFGVSGGELLVALESLLRQLKGLLAHQRGHRYFDPLRTGTFSLARATSGRGTFLPSCSGQALGWRRRLGLP